YSYSPGFVPDRSHLVQTIRIAVISPWAFIGFENIAHFSEEINYPVKKTRQILISSILFTTLVYVIMTLLSVSAYPPGYATWLDYIKDMGNLSGIESIPAFYAASVYMGNTGVNLLMVALLCVVFTSIIGNLTALSRLLYALGRDGVAPSRLSKINAKGSPQTSVFAIMIISFIIPFIGRTAIGWIVDVTTLGATILYGFLSYAVLRDAQRRKDNTNMIFGLIGSALMIGFVIFLLAPKLMTYEAMPSESYFIFAVWSLIGLVVFRIVMHHDKNHAFGRSVVVWMLFLLLILLTTMMWVNRETQTVTDESIDEIRTYYEQQLDDNVTSYDANEAEEFLRIRAERIEGLDARNTMFSYGLFILAVAIMLNNFRISRVREKEWKDALGAAQKESTTDPLTGVKNRHAFFTWSEDIDNRIVNGDKTEFAVAVCDVNDLKRVNDTLGHKAGDECIKKASSGICRIFSHSPVFRYGGDEFVVILEGEDYDRRDGLMKELAMYSENAAKNNVNSIAAGMSFYDPSRHTSLHSVFEEADVAMYENKRIMKGLTE
ncbi:MAG: amino acid permease, partial [Lachnospiraceae bacterium]|nr:amino acid permease [Lachnospiraceae bacterium]